MSIKRLMLFTLKGLKSAARQCIFLHARVWLLYMYFICILFGAFRNKGNHCEIKLLN